MLVNTVTASSCGAPGSLAACAAAAIICPPPPAWTVRSDAPVPVTERTAPATVLGMSCSFRSRKTSNPRYLSPSITRFPAA